MSPRAKQSTLVFPPGQEPKGKTEFDRFDDIIGRMLGASKEEVDRRMREHKCSEASPPKRRRQSVRTVKAASDSRKK